MSLYRKMAISDLPRTGLGNKLFSWASGVIFSHINHCPHYITGMTKFHLGPWMRGESSKRLYRNYFINERVFVPAKLWHKTYHLSQGHCDQPMKEKAIAVFSEVPPWDNLFHTLKQHRAVVCKKFWETLATDVQQKIDQLPRPEIAVHIRMGDFAKVDHQDFKNTGNARTPLSYFVHTIKWLRDNGWQEAKVTIFSDGKDEELSEVLALQEVERAKASLDIVHLASMSQSKILITSAGSTFSYWAAFLSEAMVIHHPDHFHSTMRDDNSNQRFFEGILPLYSKQSSKVFVDHFSRVKERSINHV